MQLRVFPNSYTPIECTDEEYARLIRAVNEIVSKGLETFQNYGIAAVFAQVHGNEKPWWSWSKFNDSEVEVSRDEFERHVSGPFVYITVPGYLNYDYEYCVYFEGTDLKQIFDTLALSEVMCS